MAPGCVYVGHLNSSPSTKDGLVRFRDWPCRFTDRVRFVSFAGGFCSRIPFYMKDEARPAHLVRLRSL